jgi:hypothetical protein
MKCPECSNTQKFKEGMKCTRCGYHHIFSKKTHDITDAQFMAVLRGASAGETRYFTFDHLYARYCRGRVTFIAAIMKTVVHTLGKFGQKMMIGGVLVTMVGALVSSGVTAGVGVGLFLLGVLLYFSDRESVEEIPGHRAAASETKLRWLLDQWHAEGRLTPKLISRPALQERPMGYREADLFDYGVERIIIVERDILVDFLVRNNVHAEQKALVIAESGYPQYLLPHIEKLLMQRPDLPVVLLHDSTEHGVAMAERIKKSELFPLADHKLIDAGLYPAQVKSLKSLEPLVPESTAYRLPVDTLPFAAMISGLAGATMLPMYGAALVDQNQNQLFVGTTSGGDGGSADFGTDGDGGDGDFG